MGCASSSARPPQIDIWVKFESVTGDHPILNGPGPPGHLGALRDFHRRSSLYGDFRPGQRMAGTPPAPSTTRCRRPRRPAQTHAAARCARQGGKTIAEPARAARQIYNSQYGFDIKGNGDYAFKWQPDANKWHYITVRRNALRLFARAGARRR